MYSLINQVGKLVALHAVFQLLLIMDMVNVVFEERKYQMRIVYFKGAKLKIVDIFAYSYTRVFTPFYFGLYQSIEATLYIKYIDFYIGFCKTKDTCNKFITSAKMLIKSSEKMTVEVIV